jgi:hypothetical protein
MDKHTIGIVIGVSAFFLVLHIFGALLRRRLGERGRLWESIAYSITGTALTVYVAVLAYTRRSEDLFVAGLLFALTTCYLWQQVKPEKGSHAENSVADVDRLTKSRWLGYLLVTIVAFGLILGTQVVDCSYQGHSTVGNYAHEALFERDAKQLLSLVSHEEVEGNMLTETNLRKFIDDYVFRGNDQVTVAEVYPAGPDFPAAVSYWYRDYRMDGGEIKHIGIHVENKGNIINLIPLLLAGSQLHRDGDSEVSLADVIDRDIDILNATGIKGVYYDSAFKPWQEYAAALRIKQ